MQRRCGWCQRPEQVLGVAAPFLSFLHALTGGVPTLVRNGLARRGEEPGIRLLSRAKRGFVTTAKLHLGGDGTATRRGARVRGVPG